ncbi:ATP/GTP-binding protein [Streptacidiphilus sp. P02-A3a]|uniref:AAA family ATPase n=1 Tax=Streptacidiphilus sp. P02-A3a TaxID=2704468 RepID=UPI0015FCB340|nr:ATP-binding protein [Streptacidiphilus sp. P02-A3a]QMU68140.1 ATP-binding protein [Streptacidiphilus sp. P02-A3a]
MLLNFRTANHRSIRDEQQLQLHPAFEADRPEGTDWQAVPVVGIFGANAAGKSNIVDALEYMAFMVVNSHRDAEPDGGVPRRPFRLDESALSDPSWYVVDLLLDDIRYTYGFSVDDERVVNEWLYSYPLGKKRKIFERSDGDFEPGDSQEKRELRLVESITEPNVLFMSLAARSKQSDFQPVYQWFQKGLNFRRLKSPTDVLEMNRFFETPKRYPELVELLRAADLGIEEWGVEEIQTTAPRRPHGPIHKEGRQFEKVTRPWIGQRGRDGVVRMSLQDQSAGTRALLEQLPRFLAVLRHGGTLVVDEIDSSLHPRLTAQLIRMFQDPETNKHGAQLIFTSHDASLLGKDSGEDILKRDQVWFVEKNQYGESEIFALAEFKPRRNENRERRYLGGSYGGVPFIDSSFTRALLQGEGTADGAGAEAERP